MKESVLNILCASALFKNISKKRAAELLKNCDVDIKCIEKGAAVFSQTSFSRSLGIIIKGSARVEKASGEKEVIMSTLEAGSVFGMAALFYEKINYPTVITALKPCTIAFLPKEWLTDVFKKEPAIAENYITILSQKIHFLTEKIETLSRRGECGKLYSYILSEYKKHGSNNEVTLTYNMAELSKVLGIGRTTLYRELDTLISGKYIDKNGKTITILKSEEL